MQTLNITEEKAERLNELEDAAIKEIKSVLVGNKAPDATTKIAMTTISNVAKNRQTNTNRSAIEFAMVRQVGTDDQVKRLISLTSPIANKALTGKNK